MSTSRDDKNHAAEIQDHKLEEPAATIPAHEEEKDSWPLQADRMAIRNPLLACLQILAGHYGRRTSVASLTAGLPMSKEGISPVTFARAAERANMNAQLAERSLESLKIAPNLPCILVLEDGQACILWGMRQGTNKKKKTGQKLMKAFQAEETTGFIVQFAETVDKKQVVPIERLKENYTGYAFFVRPVARSDDRAGPAEIDTGRSWFWAVFKKHKVLYAEVFISAIMINVFGVVSSMYVMNVYDKVVPNSAFESLWALTFGVCIAYVFDFMLKQLRSHFLDFAGRKADVTISAELFEQILGMTMAARPASAGVLASKMREFETIRDFFTSATLVAFIDLPFVFLYIAFMGRP